MKKDALIDLLKKYDYEYDYNDVRFKARGFHHGKKVNLIEISETRMGEIYFETERCEPFDLEIIEKCIKYAKTKLGDR